MGGLICGGAEATSRGPDLQDELVVTLLEVEDRSSGSVELARRIVDWPTWHHFSPQRANLLRPLRLGARQRVLEVGAGSGALTRHIGEQDADVLALEADATLARAARLRCQDLDRVEVRHGRLDDVGVGERFDAVVFGDGFGEGESPGALLRRARSLLAPRGAVVVAAPNQLGLRHLVGADDAVAGRPWRGIDDYPGGATDRTWTRRELADMLEGAGLGHQRWMAPFPDHRLPSVVLDRAAYDQSDATDLIEQLVLHPLGAMPRPPVRLVDGGAVHGVFVRAGLAFEVANSFLVVAAPSAGGVEALVPAGVLAWLFGGIRVAPWQRTRVLDRDRRVVTLTGTEVRSVEWLQQDPGDVRPFLPGRTLHQRALAAARAHDLAELGDVLRAWNHELEARADPIVAGAGEPPHPFLRARTTRGLPDGYLDVALSNFLETDDGLVLIDDEWRTGHPVDLDLARHRALWAFARELVSQGVEHPWGDRASVDDVMRELARLTGVDLDGDVESALRRAEVELQRLVADEPSGRVLTGWFDGSLRAVDLLPGAGLVPGERGEEPGRLADELGRLAAERDRLAAERDELAAERDRLAAERNQLAAERSEYRGQSAHLTGVVAALETEIRRLRRPRGFLAEMVRSRSRSRGR